jgi:thioredoxin-dependent peroxiredoxin
MTRERVPLSVRYASTVLAIGLSALAVLTVGTAGAAELEVGDRAPDFELPASDGNVYRLSDMHGSAVILAWFPRAFTRGCTIECKSLVEDGHLLRAYDVHYFMASVDPLDDNQRFAEATQADFPLLSDESKRAAAEYGVLNEHGVASRHNFYIAPDGTILAIDRNVRPSTAAEDMAAQLEALGVRKRSAGQNR